MHCAKVIDYLELIGQEEIQFFADHETDHMPKGVDAGHGNEANDGVGAEGVEVENEGIGEGRENIATEIGLGAKSFDVENEGVDVGNGDDANIEVGAEGVEDDEGDRGGLESLEQNVEAGGSEGEDGDEEARNEGEVESDDDSSVYSDDFGESDDDELKLGQFMASVEEGEEGNI
ncbi:acidic leucine-rich nuclear phosphoprotein 32-related protein 2-like [Salvia miltiorrhiza]|uniref:acidic leucine-rich nuclear phosphoprotein 32-related protein 2-like n=1 Tax=Salvia miltiorrhiza TaxID=226208 RepID=UPI0025ABFE0F|nr:acidic leucine-rich nuclear phosphoprotein 32-related protein 2-like [Salvia miltiorrhiza]